MTRKEREDREARIDPRTIDRQTRSVVGDRDGQCHIYRSLYKFALKNAQEKIKYNLPKKAEQLRTYGVSEDRIERIIFKTSDNKPLMKPKTVSGYSSERKLIKKKMKSRR